MISIISTTFADLRAYLLLQQAEIFPVDTRQDSSSILVAGDMILDLADRIRNERKSLEAQSFPEPEPTPTEMVRRLLEKGWEVVETDYGINFAFRHENFQTVSLRQAYRRAFPPKKRVEVEVWMNKLGYIYGPKEFDSLPDTEEKWYKATAIFWVEDE